MLYLSQWGVEVSSVKGSRDTHRCPVRGALRACFPPETGFPEWKSTCEPPLVVVSCSLRVKFTYILTCLIPQPTTSSENLSESPVSLQTHLFRSCFRRRPSTAVGVFLQVFAQVSHRSSNRLPGTSLFSHPPQPSPLETQFLTL